MEFKKGHCYFEKGDNTDSPKIMLCRHSIFRGQVLVPYRGFRWFPIPASGGDWVDCTEQVKRSEALQNCDYYPLTPITESMVGTIIAFKDEEYGQVMTRPYFLFAYANGMAYCMSLDGHDQVFNIKLTHCYPLQRVYADIAQRAMSPDPLQSSSFDGFFRWLRKTNQYRSFTSMVESTGVDLREDMIKLFELMTFNGVTSENFESEVDKLYAKLPASQQAEAFSKYSAVLAVYGRGTKPYSKVDKEIMRATGFKYKTPQEAWDAVGSGGAYPKSLMEVNITTKTPHQYICDAVGLYDGESDAFWYGELCLRVGEYLDMETQYEEGVERYLEINPEFDQKQLEFIKEKDKASVMSLFGAVQDPKDPWRSWVAKPRTVLLNMASQNPKLSYVELAKLYYTHTYQDKEES